MLQLVFATCHTKDVEGRSEYAFGLDNGLPWGHVAQDMKNFKARTGESILIMGAKTWESFQKPLPGRRSIVVVSPGRGKPKTKNGTMPDEIMYLDEFKRFLKGDVIITSTATAEYPWDTTVSRNNSAVSIIGGKSLIKQAVYHVDRIVHTSIIKKHRVNSDVQMDADFIHNMRLNKAIETHWYHCDELTDIIETVYEVTNV